MIDRLLCHVFLDYESEADVSNQAVFQKFYKAPIKLEMSIIELDQTIFHFPTK